MEDLPRWLDQVLSLVWGGPAALLLLVAGAYLSFVLRGVQLRRLRMALRIGLWDRDEPGGDGDISHYQSLMVALGGSGGVGNLLGVAAALAAGGPGALLWLWVAGWLAMATRYAEGVLGVYYRESDRRGRMAGGPMYYLSRGVGGWFGRLLAVLFAAMAVLAALAVGSAIPSQVAAGALHSSLSIPPVVTGLVLAGATAAVVGGGVRAIGRTAGLVVPFLVVACLLGALVVLVLNWRRIDDALLMVAQGAFSTGAVAGGVAGGAVREVVRWGVGQGLLSSGSGMGTAGIVSAAARTRTATTQALVAMTQTFIDTVVVSGLMGLAILAAGAHLGIDPATGAAYTGAPLIMAALRSGLPGDLGGAIVSLGLTLFAFTSVLAWAHYGARSAEYLLGSRATRPFRALLVAASFAGGLVLQLGWAGAMAVVWGIGGVVGGLMVVPNLIGVLLLSGVVVRETGRSPGTR